MRVAFQGELGAYSEEAIIQHFGGEALPVPRPYLKDVFDSVENGEADLGLVPAENSLEGSIVRTFDLLLERVGGQAPALKAEVLSPRPQAKRPAQRPAGPRPLRPADASDVVGWRDAWAEIVRREGSAAAAGRLLGVGQPTASRWTSGRRKPQPQAQQRIVDLAAQLGGAQGDAEQRAA